MGNTDILRIEMLLTEILQELRNSNRQVEVKQWPLVMDAKQASEFTGIKPTKLYQYAKMKGFPVIRDETVGGSSGRVFFCRDGLEEWVRENTRKTLR